MSITVIEPGLFTTIQDMGRHGWRHQGVPTSGAADTLSLAIANRLVGNPAGASALECTLIGVKLQFDEPCTFALAGGVADCTLSNEPVCMHETMQAQKGDLLTIGTITKGVRLYLAVAGAGGFSIPKVLGSASTYTPAALGGYQGRILQQGDVLHFASFAKDQEKLITPPELQLPISDGWVLRVTAGPEVDMFPETAGQAFFSSRFTASRRADRMGMALEGQKVMPTGENIKSAPVFPGTVQCPPGGTPFLLMADAQTTGGYPRIAQVIRADRHMLGQIKPGDTVRFMQVGIEQAQQTLKEKTGLFEPWLGACPFI
jgi:biotin-dependent carboxylase-like uncharacterized protein